MPTILTASNVDPTSIATLTASQVLSNKTLLSAKEDFTSVATAPPAPLNYDFVSQSVLYYTANATANFTWNVRGNISTTLNSSMTIGESVTVALFVTNGATAYYPSAFQIDGSAVTPKYQNGLSITAGNINSTDLYVWVILKTAASTYTSFLSQTKFA
jgi:hypothetical protein